MGIQTSGLYWGNYMNFRRLFCYAYFISLAGSAGKSFHSVANRRDGCTLIAVFEVKEEIPANLECRARRQ